MIRRLAGGDWAGAAGKLRALLPLAGSLARVCPAPCRRACRRRLVDSPIDICALKSAVTEAGLGSSGLPSPPVDPPSGRSVAVVGAGAAGLSAAWFLAQSGHRCLIFDGETDPGGMLRSAIVQGRLPAHVLEADINVLRSTGIDLRFGSRVSSGEELEELRRGFDAVVLATGSLEMLRTLLPPGTEVDQTTGACTREGLFACGNATRAQPSRMAVRAVADGRKAARSVDQFLSGRAVPQERTAFDSRIHSIESADLSLLVEAAARRAARRTIVAEHGQPRPASSWAVEEAIRCLRCDCARQRTCRLRQLATETGVDGRRFGSGERRLLRTVGSNGLSLEDGKCIKCGICVRIAESSGDRPGLAFSGRGSQVRVRVPFGGDLGDAVPKSAGMCVDRCPTGALAWDL
jgi:glycine/D-amino acid oxidase-like deaminating enzyme